MKTSNRLFFVLVAMLLAGCDPETIDPTPKGSDGTFKDARDQHEYKYIIYGKQTWMVENLHYLPTVDSSGTISATQPHYYVYGYEGTSLHDAWLHPNFANYGVLYNWPAASTACPDGWHLPTDAEWTTLTDYLIAQGYGFEGSGSDIGKAMASTSGWFESPTSTRASVGNAQGINNRSGFGAFPGGVVRQGYGFDALSFSANLWTSTPFDDTHYWIRQLFSFSEDCFQNFEPPDFGFSVRCVKD